MIRILSVAVPVRILTLVLTETAILFGCFFLSVWLDSDLVDIATFVGFDAGFQRIAILVLTIMLGMYMRDLYANVRTPGYLALAQELFVVFGSAFVGQGLIHYVADDLTIPRKMMLIGSPISFAALMGWRLFFDAAARDVRSAQRILFLGISPAALELSAYLRQRPEIGLNPIGYISEHSPEGPANAGLLPHLGGFPDLDAVIEREEPASLVIADRAELLPRWSEAFLELEFGGIRIEEVTALYERIFGRVHVSSAVLSRFIFSDAFEPDRATSRLQSIYSPILAGATLILLSPLLALVALLIRVTSSGPVLESDYRLGQEGVPFLLWRFRVTGCAGEKAIRRLGIDALPQLWNVVRGTMSLVGPAPDRPDDAAELAHSLPCYLQRMRVKPGLTGWEQVHRYERPSGDVLRRLEYDLYYVKNLAPSLDSAVLMLALKARLL